VKERLTGGGRGGNGGQTVQGRQHWKDKDGKRESNLKIAGATGKKRKQLLPPGTKEPRRKGRQRSREKTKRKRVFDIRRKKKEKPHAKGLKGRGTFLFGK